MPPYQQSLPGPVQSAENILATAKAQLKEAKTAREQRRKEKELNAQEEAELIRESQFQKAEYKRLERSWKARITTLQTQTEDWERRISALKSERKNPLCSIAAKAIRTVRDAELPGRSQESL